MKQKRVNIRRGITTCLAFSMVAAVVPDAFGSLAGRRVGIDPGHGAGINQGVVISEGTWVLDAGLRARGHLQNHGATVIMTRTTGSNPAISTRYNLLNSNNAHVSISIHSNAASAAANGMEAYYCNVTHSSNSYNLANRLRLRSLSMVHNNNRGTKECLAAQRGFHFGMIRYTNHPSSLPEYYFHTNSWENINIHNTASGRENVARSLYAGVCDYYGVTPTFGGGGGGIGSGGIIVDNTSSGFSASSSWWTSSNVSGHYGSNYHVRATGALSDPATWSFTVRSRGDYEVFARWTAASDRATAAPYIINHANGSTTVNVNQTANGGQWRSLGTYRFGGSSPTTHTVQLSCWTTSGPYVVADAIRLVPKTVWVDNHHSGFAASSNWGVATWASDKYGSNYAFRDTQAISDAATWTVHHLTSGSYQVQAWWTAAANRASSAPYIVHRSGGTSTVNANQRQNGGQWRTLGTFTLPAGENQVQLSCWTTSGDVVVADAVRWRLQ